MMKSFRTNFWLIIPILIIIPTIVTTVIIHEISEQELIDLGMEFTIQENEFQVKEIISNVESIYELIDSKIDFITASAKIDGVVSEEENYRLNQMFEEINKTVPITFTITDNNFRVFYSKGQAPVPIGTTVNEFPSIIESSISMETTIGHVIEGSRAIVLLSNPYTINGKFEGTVLASFALEDIIKQHGNVETEEESFLFVIDKNYDIIVDPVLVGNNLFDEAVVGHIGLEEKEVDHYDQVLGGEKFHTSVYVNNLGERIDTGGPVLINDKIEYFLFVVTPTSPMRSQIADITFADQLQTVGLLVIVGIFVIAFSLKQRKKIKLDKLAMIGHLSSNIAHDIRNPLGAIRNASVIISKENNGNNEKITREIDRIKISTKRISHQVEEVLNYVRTTPLNLKNKSILETIKESIASLDIPENIVLKLPENDITFPHDREKILIVFVNIILNAIQAIEKESGSITIKIQEQSSYAIIHFENSGPQISEEALPKLFEPLFTTRLKGTGLGLSSCKNIIEQHKGEISVSQMPVTFSVRISKSLK